MSNKLSYADAVKLLGGGDKGIVGALDRLTGGLVQATTGGTGQLLLSLFDAEGELASLNKKLVTGLGDKLRGLGRFDRTSRLRAAHKIIIVTGFFEAVNDMHLPFNFDSLQLDRATQISISTDENIYSQRLSVLAGILDVSEFSDGPPQSASIATPESLEGYYRELSGRLIDYVKGLEEWDQASEMGRETFVKTICSRVPQLAVRRYEELLRQLAAEFPEVTFWVNRLDHVAITYQLLRIQTGLEGLGQVLSQLTLSNLADNRRQAIARRYEKDLDRPIVAAGDAPEGLTIPTLATGYIHPRYRVSRVTVSDPIDQESWWDEQPIFWDFQEFLISHLTSITATEAPLIVLGQPGSGKSVLTKVIAARLPARDYLAVRVELREVPADTDLQTQIEYAVRDATGETISWPDLARSGGGVLPVILLDGFDELLQATGIGQTDYLEQITKFQQREADQGRPTAVIITSRTAVADRARVPVAGAIAVRLEPFDDDQISRWLAIWNASNAAYLAGRHLEALPLNAVLQHRVLAAQPLLLLMLALYDSTDNALQHESLSFSGAELYERILTNFAEREIHKRIPALKGELLESAVQEELLHLSIAAFAMFNRGRQWVSEEDLSSDLTTLLGIASTSRPMTGSQPLASLAQLVVGRFFFIHEAQAIRSNKRLMTCEFLHATFGEFLSSRLIMQELSGLASTATTHSKSGIDVNFMRALISFAPLTTRSTIVEFLVTLARKLDDDSRTLLRGLLITAFQESFESPTSLSYEDYRPSKSGAPARHAAYSANLLLLIALITGPVTSRELFPGVYSPVTEWRRHAMLWRSQFSGEGWRSLALTLRLQRTWNSSDREICISLEPWEAPRIDSFWTHRISPDKEQREGYGWRHIYVSDARRESYFMCDTVEDIIWHGLEPIITEMDVHGQEARRENEATTAFGVLSPERLVSVTHAMTNLWVKSSSTASTDELLHAYQYCIDTIGLSRPPDHTRSRNDYYSRVLRQLAADRDRLPPEFRAKIFIFFKESIFHDASHADRRLFREWWEQAFSDLEDYLSP